MEFSFGSLLPNIYGSTGIGYSASSASGSLNRPIHAVFLLPADATAISHEAAVLSAGSATDACARWTTADGTDHAVGPRILSASGGWPTIAICDIPRLANVDNLRIGLQAGLSAPTFRWFSDWAEHRDGQQPADAPDHGRPRQRNGPSRSPQPHGQALPPLHPAPRRHRVLHHTTQPAPSNVGLQTRQWQVGSGGYVSARMINPQRHNLLDIAQQFLLLLAGTFFGLVPAALPRSKSDRGGLAVA